MIYGCDSKSSVERILYSPTPTQVVVDSFSL
uniref:Uncharacterized protein n=1 Tax=Arundo donax TaxID=35708 RepID=A0A0A9GWF3_ARUDO